MVSTYLLKDGSHQCWTRTLAAINQAGRALQAGGSPPTPPPQHATLHTFLPFLLPHLPTAISVNLLALPSLTGLTAFLLCTTHASSCAHMACLSHLPRLHHTAYTATPTSPTSLAASFLYIPCHTLPHAFLPFLPFCHSALPRCAATCHLIHLQHYCAYYCPLCLTLWASPVPEHGAAPRRRTPTARAEDGGWKDCLRLHPVLLPLFHFPQLAVVWTGYQDRRACASTGRVSWPLLNRWRTLSTAISGTTWHRLPASSHLPHTASHLHPLLPAWRGCM